MFYPLMYYTFIVCTVYISFLKTKWYLDLERYQVQNTGCSFTRSVTLVCRTRMFNFCKLKDFSQELYYIWVIDLAIWKRYQIFKIFDKRWRWMMTAMTLVVGKALRVLQTLTASILSAPIHLCNFSLSS